MFSYDIATLAFIQVINILVETYYFTPDTQRNDISDVEKLHPTCLPFHVYNIYSQVLFWLWQTRQKAESNMQQWP